MASTAQEVLIAELLGDVGKLHDSVKALPKAMSQHLTPVCDAVAAVTRDAQSTIDRYGTAQENRLKSVVEEGRSALRADVVQVMREVADRQAAACGVLGRWKTACIVFGAVVAGMLVGYALTLTLNEQFQGYAHFGKATSAAWEHLDSKAKTTIQDQLSR